MKKIYFFAIFSTILGIFVVALGAYTRLTDAGLGCPDWPGCYGHALVSNIKNSLDPNFDSFKAWTEMVHRYFAGTLGICVLFLALFSFKNYKTLNLSLFIPIALSITIIFQALLGMWTVTLKLMPSIVSGHLLGGMTLVSLLFTLCLKLHNYCYSANKSNKLSFSNNYNKLKWLAFISLVILFIQIMLGAWTSSNYAALSCPDFPFCSINNYFPFDLNRTFNIFNNLDQLEYSSRATIHMMHRLGALIVFILLLSTVFIILKTNTNKFLNKLSIAILFILSLQILLGISNIILLLPLSIAVAHNVCALILLLLIASLNFYLSNENI